MSFLQTPKKHSLSEISGPKIELIWLGDGQSSEDDEGSVAVESAQPKLKKPALFQVLLMNDDFTPMDFVIHILEQFFSMGRESATQVMLAVHTQGKGVCGVYTKDIAETKAAIVNECAKDNDHPLLCEVEEIDD